MTFAKKSPIIQHGLPSIILQRTSLKEEIVRYLDDNIIGCIKKWRFKMKKLLATVLSFTIIANSIMLTGCVKNGGDDKQKKDIGKAVVTETKDANNQNENGEVITDSIEIAARAQAILEKMSLSEKIGQMFMVNLESLDHTQGSYYEHRKVTKEMRQKLSEYPVGGVILFSRNIETRKQTQKLNEELQKNSRIPLWISVDEEGGDIARIANNPNMKTTQFPSMEVVGATENAEYCMEMGKTIGSEIKELGFNLDFAPVADVRTNENNTEIGNRSFGNDPEMVAEYSTNVVKGLQKAGVSATLKHFPGHGDADGDTHESSVNIESDISRLRNVDFVPFQSGIEAGADFLMISHISISRVSGNSLPASLSKMVMKDIARDELKFQGVIITDAMDMKAITNHFSPEEAAVKAVEAGADVILMPADFVKAYNEIVHAVIEKKIPESRIDESVQRILENKIKRGLILSNSELIYKK